MRPNYIPDKPKKVYYTISEAVSILGMSETTVRKRLVELNIKRVPRTSGGRMRLTKELIDKLRNG